MPENNSPSIRLNSFWLLLGRVLGQGLLVIFVALVARYLGEEGLGQYALVTAVILLGNVFTTFGLDTLLIREVAARRGQTGLMRPFPLPLTALLVQLFLSALFIGGVWLLAGRLPGQTPTTIGALKLYSLSLLPLTLATVYSAILRGYERMDLYTLYTLASALLQTVGALLVLRAGGGLLALVGWLLLVQAITAVFVTALCYWTIPRLSLRHKVEWATLRATVWPTLHLAWPLALLMVLAVWQQRLGIFALSFLAGDAETGWFSAAAKVIEAAKMGHYAFFGALFPVLARGAGGRPAEKRSRTADREPVSVTAPSSGQALGPPTSVTRFPFALLLGLTLLVMLLITLGARPLVQLLYGAGYAPAVTALAILAWSLLPYTMGAKLSLELVAAGRERVVLRAVALTLATSLLLFGLLVPSLGLIGACWAVVLGELVQAVILYVKRET
ncbi:MAG: oligosaccharide flippase family protein [Chloroflexota bacterium]